MNNEFFSELELITICNSMQMRRIFYQSTLPNPKRQILLIPQIQFTQITKIVYPTADLFHDQIRKYRHFSKNCQQICMFARMHRTKKQKKGNSISSIELNPFVNNAKGIVSLTVDKQKLIIYLFNSLRF